MNEAQVEAIITRIRQVIKEKGLKGSRPAVFIMVDGQMLIYNRIGAGLRHELLGIRPNFPPSIYKNANGNITVNFDELIA